MSYYNHVRKLQAGGKAGRRDPAAAAIHDRFDLFATEEKKEAPVNMKLLPGGIPKIIRTPTIAPAFQTVSRRPANMPIVAPSPAAVNPVTVTPVVPVIPAAPVVTTTSAAVTKPAAVKRQVTSTSTRTPEKANSTAGKIKFIQRSLGVKADGMWGPKTQAAFEKMKATQESLGLTGKEVDGIRGTKTREALNKRDNEASALIQSIKASDTNDRSNETILNPVKSMTNRESRQEGRRVRRILREEERELRRNARRENADFAFKQGGILYSKRK